MRWQGKGVGVPKMCTDVLNAKMIPVETIPRIGGKGIKESGGGDEFKYNIFYIL
jgi:hypothetical protein